jgi:ferredoxin-NADP reductase
MGFVAGGTGVAPLVQMIRTILADPAEKTLLSLVFANRCAKNSAPTFAANSLSHPDNSFIGCITCSRSGGNGAACQHCVSV